MALRIALAAAALLAAAIAPAPPAAAASELVFPVPVAVVYPGDVIEEGMVVERAFHPSYLGRLAMVPESDGLIGKVARRTLLPGRPVPMVAVSEPDLVKRGVPVEVVFQDRGLTIRAQAMSLEAGSEGELIRVRNLDSGLIVTGRVDASGVVRVGGT